jgi:hypothetical protein
VLWRYLTLPPYRNKLDVLSAVHLIGEPWRLITPTTIKTCFVKRGFLIENVSSNDDSALQLNGNE